MKIAEKSGCNYHLRREATLLRAAGRAIQATKNQASNDEYNESTSKAANVVLAIQL
jgi:hypothetical protein